MSEPFIFADITITCADCQQPFLFTVGEQAFYRRRAFTPPRRCKPCRDFRKAERDTPQEAA